MCINEKFYYFDGWYFDILYIMKDYAKFLYDIIPGILYFVITKNMSIYWLVSRI